MTIRNAAAIDRTSGTLRPPRDSQPVACRDLTRANVDPQEFDGITSVLMPLYNHQDYVAQALDSLLSSDCSRIELIISDDASADDSQRIATEWLATHGSRFHRTRLIANPVNLGLTANLNRLVSAANGEFITYLASDDTLGERAIDRQREYLSAHPSADFVFSNCAIIDLSNQLLKASVISDSLALFLKIPGVLMINVMFNWNIVWARLFGRRRRLLELGDYDERHCIEDRWQALKILNSGRYGYIHDIVHNYRYRGFEAHPMIKAPKARSAFHESERRIHKEARGLLYLLLWVRRLPFRTNRGQWPARLAHR